jgi:hypothetical protein
MVSRSAKINPTNVTDYLGVHSKNNMETIIVSLVSNITCSTPFVKSFLNFLWGDSSVSGWEKA